MFQLATAKNIRRAAPWVLVMHFEAQKLFQGWELLKPCVLKDWAAAARKRSGEGKT